MLKLTINEASYSERLNLALCEYVSSQAAELVQWEMDLGDDTEYNFELLFPGTYVKEHSSEECIEVLKSIHDRLASYTFYQELTPLQQYVLYNVIEAACEWEDNSSEDKVECTDDWYEEFERSLPDEVKKLIYEEIEEADFIIESCEDICQYIGLFFEDTDFLEDNIRSLVELAIRQTEVFVKKEMSLEDLDKYIEVMPIDVVTEYKAFRERYKQEEDRGIIVNANTIRQDILEIGYVLTHGVSYDKLIELHRMIDCKYSYYMLDIGLGMWGFTPENGFNYESLGERSIRENLLALKSKLEGLIIDTKDKEVVSDTMNKKVFVVHGRKEGVRDDIELFLRRIGLEPIVLCNQPDSGLTIIEKIEKYTDVNFAVVLYTDCDLGKLKSDVDLKPRARQNVVFEHGYLIAKLTRKNVVALVEPGVEIPGDLSGIIYISLAETDWKQHVMKEMNNCGMIFDWSKV